MWVGASGTPFVAVGGNSGSDTARIQQRLIDLGFWLSGVDGDYGLTTSQAVMAFQKYLGLEASGRVNQATADALTSVEWRAHALADAGTLVEIDKDKQLLFVVQNGRTVWIFNTSTGNGEPYEEEDQNTPGEVQTGVSITRNGLHAVYRERAEGWWEGDLGKIYRPKYFSRRAGRPRLEQRARLPGVTRLRACVDPGDGLHLGGQPDAHRHPRLGARRALRVSLSAPSSPASSVRRSDVAAVIRCQVVDAQRMVRPRRVRRRTRLRCSRGWPALVRQRPVSRSKRQPCSVQTSSQPSTSPNTLRSALRCGQRRCTTHPSSSMSGSVSVGGCSLRSASASVRRIRPADSDLRKL